MVNELIQLRHFDWLAGVISPLAEFKPAEEIFPDSIEHWQSIITAGSAHLVLPHLYVALRQKNLWNLPNDVAEALTGFYELNQLHNQQLRQQIYDVTQTLNDIGIVPVWLKGATNLAENNWSISPRTMLDLDLWLPDPATHDAALAALQQDGYVEEVADDHGGDTFGHHFCRRVKMSMLAGIEVHKDIVGKPANRLLDNKIAFGNVCWFEWEGLKIGALSKLDQCLQSYIQCTEMNRCGLLLGQIKLMKAHDFITRYLTLNQTELVTFTHLLGEAQWKHRAESFFTYLNKFFGLESPFAPNDALCDRVRANYQPGDWIKARVILIEYYARLFFEKLKSKELGAPMEVLKKGWRLISQFATYRPEL